MCGICGELRFDGAAADLSAVRRMADTLAHRGPDGADAWSEGPIALGHRRLAIIDLSDRGRQPMWTADRSMAIVFNGEIYNFVAIRRLLEQNGYRFQSDCDTEVLLNAVHCWGTDAAVSKFIGMFAFAVWDARARTLTLCRDRAGVKPLYYFTDGACLIFASELKALYTHASFTRQLDPAGVSQFFVLGYTAGRTTTFRQTFRVGAAETLRVSLAGALEHRPYWTLADVEPDSYRGTFDQASEELSALAEDAFGYRLVSDVPVGLFLSGGIDSSYLASVLRRRLGADLLHITIGFRESGMDEAGQASNVARQLGVRHVVRYLEPPDAADALRQFVDVYDEPFADTSGLAASLISRVAREHVKVALSADGGDEQFGGYESYDQYARYYRAVRAVPLPLRRLSGLALRRLVPYAPLLSALPAGNGSRRPPAGQYEKLTELLRVETTADLLTLMNAKGWTPASVGDIVRASVANALAGTPIAAAPDARDHDRLVETMMRTDYAAFMRDDVLAKMDRASMAASLECRDPFLDHRLAEFAYRLPIDFLIRGTETKRILRRLLRAWIDPSIVNAPKRGFSVPLYKWMHGPWAPLIDEYLSPAAIRRVGVLDDRTVRAEVERFRRWRSVPAERVLLMLTFQMWAHRWYLRSAA